MVPIRLSRQDDLSNRSDLSHVKVGEAGAEYDLVWWSAYCHVDEKMPLWDLTCKGVPPIVNREEVEESNSQLLGRIAHLEKRDLERERARLSYWIQRLADTWRKQL